MCLCALIYNKRHNINSPQNLAQIMNIGNELYLNVSRLARQSFLLFTEMPLNLNVLGTDYHFDYSTAIQGVSKKSLQFENIC